MNKPTITVTLHDITVTQLLGVAIVLAIVLAEQDEHHSCGGCQEEAPVAEPKADENTHVSASPVDVVIELLSDPRFDLRSTNAIISALSKAFPNDPYELFSNESLLRWLNDNGVAYYTKTRRRDGAMMIGLHKEPVGAVQGTIPAVTPVAEAVADNKFAKLMEMLEHPDYTYRTVATLLEKTGYTTFSAMKEDLDNNDVDIEYADRTSDGARMIGLSSRV